MLSPCLERPAVLASGAGSTPRRQRPPGRSPRGSGPSRTPRRRARGSELEAVVALDADDPDLLVELNPRRGVTDRIDDPASPHRRRRRAAFVCARIRDAAALADPHCTKAAAGYTSTTLPPPDLSGGWPVALQWAARRRAHRIATTPILSVETLSGVRLVSWYTARSWLSERQCGRTSGAGLVAFRRADRQNRGCVCPVRDPAGSTGRLTAASSVGELEPPRRS